MKPIKVIVTFTGDPRHPGSDPASIALRGIELVRGVATPLEIASADGHRLLAKLRGNHHFRVEDSPAEAEKLEAEKPKAEKPKAEKTKA